MLTLLVAAMLMHPVHETVSELEWNSETKRLEVAVRLDVLDEQWLKRQVGGRDKTSEWAIRYLQRKFQVTESTKPKQRPTYRWIGRDQKGSYVWWFFEIEPVDGNRPTMIEQTMLMEYRQDYNNHVLILDQVPRRALTLTIRQPKAKLDQAADDRIESRTPSPQ